MMKRLGITLFLALIFVLLIGCTRPSLVPSGNATETVVTPTEISISTGTSISDMPNATISPGDCLTVESDTTLGWNSEGILILSSTEDIGNNLVRRTGYKINMATREREELAETDERLIDMVVSPGGKWLAFQNYSAGNNNANLVINNASNDQNLIIPWEDQWYWIASWLDEDRLAIGIGTDSYLVLNPFTGERQLFQPDLPDIFMGQGFSGLTGRSFSPALDRAVYLEDKLAVDGNWNYILWAIDQQRSLAEFNIIVQPTAFPRWSPDGNNFAIANNIAEEYQMWPAYELFSVNRDGAITQLTNLSTLYPFVYIDEYSWSPDGKNLAFWFSWWLHQPPDYDYGIPAGDRYLAILDTENKVIINYCIQGNPNASGRIPAPVWSPNGTQLAIESPSSKGHNHVVLIDLSKKSAVRISADMTPVGWMVIP